MRRFFLRHAPPSIEKNFLQLLYENFIDRLAAFSLMLFAVCIFLSGRAIWNQTDVLKEVAKIFAPTGFLKGIPESLDPPIAVYFFLALMLDVLVSSTYWYFRVRNPKYIKKQKEYELWKVERKKGAGSPK